MSGRQWIPLVPMAALMLPSAAAVTAQAGAEQVATTAIASPAVVTDVRVAGIPVYVRFDGDQYQVGQGELIEWVRRSTSIVAEYYGVFPASTLDISIKAVNGGGVRGGKAFGQPRPSIHVTVGRAVSKAELLADWVLVHEMIHLALPEVDDTHVWLAEGLATYVEGVARVQAGNLGARELWQEYAVAMPKGMPAPDDQGLDRTHTWGRTYWGGALFCLLADVTIRERSGNRRGLQDALRAILRKSGGMITSWPVKRVFSTGDAATGTTTLTELYQAMRETPSAPDLHELWRRLGVHSETGAIWLETGTKQAEIRDAITGRPTR